MAVTDNNEKKWTPSSQVQPGPDRMVQEDIHQRKDDDHGIRNDETGPGCRTRRALSFCWQLILDQWFLVGVAVVTIIASQVQVPLAQQQIKQVAVSYLAISLTFFVAGCTIDTRILFENYARWKHHLFIQCQSFLLVSVFCYAIVRLAAISRSFMDGWLLIGMIFNGCQPTAMQSNVAFTTQAHGSTALTVVEVTVGNLIGPFITPLLIRMYLSSNTWYTDIIPSQSGGYGALYRRVFMQFGLSIYLPMAVGQVVRNLFPNAVRRIFVELYFSKIGSACMLALLWQTFDRAFATNAFSDVKQSNLIFLVFISIFNWASWLLVCFLLSRFWLDRKDTVASCMCVSAKTLALGFPLSFLMFESISELEESKIQVPMLIFQVEMLGFASLSTLLFRRWVDREERKAADEEDMVANEGSVDVTSPRSQEGMHGR